MVSNLAELRKTLRNTDRDKSPSTDGLFPAFRADKLRIERQLGENGKAELVDQQGNRFRIEHKKA